MTESTLALDLNTAKNDGELVSLLEHEFQKRNTAMSQQFRQWALNLKFYMGEQWSYWSHDTQRLVDLAKNENYKALLFQGNEILPLIETVINEFTTRRPSHVFIPRGSDFNDSRVAKACKHVNQWHASELELEEKDEYLSLLMAIFGTAYKINYWDHSGGPKFAVPIDKVDRNGTPMAEVQSHGMPAEDVVPPWELLPNMEATLQQKSFRNYIRFTPVPIDLIRQVYQRGGEVRPETSAIKYGDNRVITHTTQDKTSATDAYKDWVLLKEYHEVGTKEHPQGRIIRWANNIKLLDQEGMFKDGRMGVEVFRWFRIPGLFLGSALVEHLIDPQVEYNKARTMIIMHRDLCVRGRYTAPVGANVKMTTKPGSVIYYNHINGVSQVLKPLEVQPLGNDVYKTLELAKEEMGDIASLHQSSRGKPDNTVESGIGMAYKSEQDSMGREGILRRFHRANGRCVANRLTLEYTHRDLVIDFPITGEGNEALWYKFKRTENPMSIDVIVKFDTSIPRSQVAFREMLRRDYVDGLLGEPGSPEARNAFKLQVNSYYTDQEYSQFQSAMNQQEYELIQLEQGSQMAEVDPWNNHEVHLEVINQFRNSMQWRSLDEGAQDQVNKHYDAHLAIAPVTIQAQMEQMQQQVQQEQEQQEQQMQQLQQQLQDAQQQLQKVPQIVQKQMQDAYQKGIETGEEQVKQAIAHEVGNNPGALLTDQEKHDADNSGQQT